MLQSGTGCLNEFGKLLCSRRGKADRTLSRSLRELKIGKQRRKARAPQESAAARLKRSGFITLKSLNRRPGTPAAPVALALRRHLPELRNISAQTSCPYRAVQIHTRRFKLIPGAHSCDVVVNTTWTLGCRPVIILARYTWAEKLVSCSRSAGLMNDPCIEIIQVSHVFVDLHGSFDDVTALFERLLGGFDPLLRTTFARDPNLANRQRQGMEGGENLMIFQILDNVGLFKLIGKTQRAKCYTVGNPRIALQMTWHDIRAGLYAPFNILVVDQGNYTVRIEYDRPSSFLNQFGNAQVSEVAAQLDNKIERLIDEARRISRS
jgi:uncharacterized protein (DUF302 family)